MVCAAETRRVRFVFGLARWTLRTPGSGVTCRKYIIHSRLLEPPDLLLCSIMSVVDSRPTNRNESEKDWGFQVKVKTLCDRTIGVCSSWTFVALWSSGILLRRRLWTTKNDTNLAYFCGSSVWSSRPRPSKMPDERRPVDSSSRFKFRLVKIMLLLITI